MEAIFGLARFVVISRTICHVTESETWRVDANNSLSGTSTIKLKCRPIGSSLTTEKGIRSFNKQAAQNSGECLK